MWNMLKKSKELVIYKEKMWNMLKKSKVLLIYKK